MQLNIQGHNLELTPPLRDYAVKKIGKLQEYYKNIQKAEVTLDYRDIDDQFKAHVAEVSVWVAGKKVIRASEAGQDMYAAIDLVFDELKRQLKRHKEKHVKEVRRNARKLKEVTRTAPPLELKADGPVMVKMKQFNINNMTEQEAREQLKMSGHEFFVFRNAETSEINVLHGEDVILPSTAKALSAEEASNELKKSGANFMAFINKGTDELSVLYKRRSGNLGLIEPAL
jgi:putative sigma-54 modulation protein